MTGSLNRKMVLTYLLMPQILPRLKELSFNTSYIAYLLALIFTMTRLLPAAHPYARAINMGQFTIGDVFVAARRNLKTDVRHIDQLIVYGSLALGVILFIAMVAVLVFLLFTQAAHAASGVLPSNWFQGMFTTTYPRNDLALEMLDRVFQVPGIFGSQYMPQTYMQVTPFGRGLQAMFAFFSYGMMCIAGIISFYYIMALLLESAQSGTPFGKRFADFYAPIRLVIAILLLVPLGSGYSLGQHMVLHIAKWGSALATNSWLIFNEKTAMTPTGMSSDGLSSRELIARPSYQRLDVQLRYYTLVQACRAIYAEKYRDKEIKPYLIKYPQDGRPAASEEITSGTTFARAMEFTGNIADVHIVYGEKKDSYTNAIGNVRPYCGHMMLSTAFYTNTGTHLIKEIYFTLMNEMWNDTDLKSYGEALARNHVTPNSTTVPDQSKLQEVSARFHARYRTLFDNAIDRIRGSVATIKPIDTELLKRGWGGAGIWFNEVAETNGAIMSTTIQTPIPVDYPSVMQRSRMLKNMLNPGRDTVSEFTPHFSGSMNLGQLFSSGTLDQGDTDADIATFLGQTLDGLDSGNAFADPRARRNQNPITGLVNKIFGTDALFNLRANQEVHPLAKMAALGRGILDRAIFYLGSSIAMSGLSGVLGNSVDTMFETAPGAPNRNDPSGRGVNFGAAFDAFAGAFMAFAMVGITVGFVLYYVIPMLPFMYFFFAVGRWVKGIFEAMVCIPLWAIAHLRIDGDGIPGQAAANGYFILLELFLRPIMTIFGLVSGIAIFSAQAIVLDSIFDLIVKNVTGHQEIVTNAGTGDTSALPSVNDIDEFFYTVVYAVLVYIMALASFKMIDLIPNGIMRFMGSSVGAFSDKSSFEAESTIQMTGIAGYQLTDDLAKAGQNAAKAVGETVALPIDVATRFAAQARDAGNQGQSGVPGPSAPGAPPPPGSSPPGTGGGG